MKNSKIGLCHFFSWPKLGLEPKCHDTGTFGGFGKRAQNVSDTSGFLTLDNMGHPPPPLKNHVFENWASSCFKGPN